jgi:hypothetical protein
MSKRTLHRENSTEWCDLEIELKDGRLSICGSEEYRGASSIACRIAKIVLDHKDLEYEEAR